MTEPDRHLEQKSSSDLLERIAAEGRAERTCPECGAEREYTRVWRWKDTGHFISEGRLEMVCQVHGPFGDPDADDNGLTIYR